MKELLPPTDNLYKFCAIAGIILYLFGFYFSTKMRNIYLEKYYEIRIEQSGHTANIDYAEIRINQLKNAVDLEIAVMVVDSTKTELLRSNSTIQEMEDEINVIVRELKIKQGKIEVLDEQKDVYKRDYSLSKVFSIVSGVFGVVLAAFGFLMWYRKLQIHQDKLIKQKVM